MSEHNSDSAEQNENKDKKKSNVPVILLAIVVIAVIAFLQYTSKNNEQKTTKESTTENLPIDPSDEKQWTYLTAYMNTAQLKEILPEGDPQAYRDAMIDGVKDAFADEKVRFSDEQLQAMIARRQEVEQERFLQKAEDNKKKGEEYVAQYAQQDGVEKTENGTLYKKITSGDGALVGDQTVLVHYKGTHINGEEFDSSQKHGDTPVPFDKNIIPGLREAIALMHIGDKWEIVVPAETAYGKSVPPGGPIEPNEALIFEIEAVDIAPDSPTEEQAL